MLIYTGGAFSLFHLRYTEALKIEKSLQYGFPMIPLRLKVVASNLIHNVWSQ